MERKKALISPTVFEAKNEMRVHIRFSRTNISESAELLCAYPIFRREQFTDPI